LLEAINFVVNQDMAFVIFESGCKLVISLPDVRLYCHIVSYVIRHK